MVDKIWWKNTGPSSELVTQLPWKPSSYIRKVVFSIELPDLEVGDIVDVRAHYEVTNPYKYNLMHGRHIILATSAADTSGIDIMRRATENISPNMHHQCVASFGSLRIGSPMIGRFANIISYAGGSTSYASSGDYLKVEQDYGRAEVKVFPASMVE